MRWFLQKWYLTKILYSSFISQGKPALWGTPGVWVWVFVWLSCMCAETLPKGSIPDPVLDKIGFCAAPDTILSTLLQPGLGPLYCSSAEMRSFQAVPRKNPNKGMELLLFPLELTKAAVLPSYCSAQWSPSLWPAIWVGLQSYRQDHLEVTLTESCLLNCA